MSLPVNQRAASMSWLFTSASGPLDFAMSYIHSCGTLGPWVRDFTSTTSPISPASTRSFAARKLSS